MLIMSMFILWHEKEKYQEAQQNLQKHAQVISNAIWVVDIDLQKEYLNQARKFYHYRSLTVSDETEKELLKLGDFSNPSWANFHHEYILYENIFYEEQYIGKITVIKQSHTIFTYLYLLLFLSLVHSVFYLFLRLIKNKSILELSNKRLNQAKIKAQDANRAKSLFLANMSHELRTPLNAVLGFSSMLARDPESTRDQRDKLEIINRSGEHLLSMINDVLDLSKIEAGGVDMEPEAFDLPAILGDIGRMFEGRAKSTGLQFEMEFEPDMARFIKSDVGKLRQILINLLGNAVKFTTEGGVLLRFRTEPVEDDPAMVMLRIEIQDSGPGILPEQQELIFNPFVQAAASSSGTKGTGLGLAICKSFVDLLGGTITVESTLGVGSTFRVELPVALAEERAAGAAKEKSPEVLGLAPNQPEWRILIVEDNPENRLLLTSLLDQVGFMVQKAENGEEAVSQFKQWQPHFIWMDMSMPVLDGFGATAQIRKLPGGDLVKIVALTAGAFKEQRKSILDAGCDEVLHKPFQAHEVFDSMKKHLDVSYIYETAAESASSPVKQVTDIAKEKSLVSSLPGQLRSNLEEAFTLLDIEASYALIEDVQKVAPELANTLKMYVDEFDFDTLQKVLADD